MAKSKKTKNIEKNIEKRKKNLKKGYIGVEIPQPSPEAKKAGWERRRQAMDMMNGVVDNLKLSLAELRQRKKDIKSHPDKYTGYDKLLNNYARRVTTKGKFMLDWFDRNVGKAPQSISIEAEINQYNHNDDKLTEAEEIIKKIGINTRIKKPN